MGGTKAAPKQPTTTVDTGGFGSNTSGAFGSKFNPTQFQTGVRTQAENAFNNFSNAAYNRDVSQAKLDEFNKNFITQARNDYLAPAMQQGWLRGSSGENVAAMVGQDLYNQRQSLIDQEVARNQAMKNDAMADYLTMYDIQKGVTGMGMQANKNAADYALAKAQIDAANRQATMGAISSGLQTAGTLGSSAIKKYSDERLKENIDLLGTIDGINIYSFDYIGTKGLPKEIGVMAQEMEEKCPECVIYNYKDTEYMAVDYSKLPQEVQTKIEEFKNGNIS